MLKYKEEKFHTVWEKKEEVVSHVCACTSPGLRLRGAKGGRTEAPNVAGWGWGGGGGWEGEGGGGRKPRGWGGGGGASRSFV